MGIYLLIFVFLVVALAALFLAVRSLVSKTWFLQWLRGTIGILAIIGAVLSVLLIVNLIQYGTADEGQVIATLAFAEVNDQEYDVELTDSANNRKLYRVNGDQWQLDVRLIKFSSWFDGDLPAFKLDRLSGRYLSLEQQNNSQSKAYDLADVFWVDTWGWFAKQRWLEALQVKYGSATYMPMADGAIYQIRLFQDGLDASAVNDQAKEALSAWQ
ncbi:hypothetical protein NBRC116188_01260 [Oceaniserpentilla sp. 4NH20-0058]|uniref:hypothetical protein n=1 Tax=Oceaniserpentilla sp. 4NH20-0058 TaxID=3127660 RepID=UPI00310C03A4